jgi:hypothetical protein
MREVQNYSHTVYGDVCLLCRFKVFCNAACALTSVAVANSDAVPLGRSVVVLSGYLGLGGGGGVREKGSKSVKVCTSP